MKEEEKGKRETQVSIWRRPEKNIDMEIIISRERKEARKQARHIVKIDKIEKLDEEREGKKQGKKNLKGEMIERKKEIK